MSDLELLFTLYFLLMNRKSNNTYNTCFKLLKNDILILFNLIFDDVERKILKNGKS